MKDWQQRLMGKAMTVMCGEPLQNKRGQNVEIANFHRIAMNSTFYIALLSWKPWILVKIMLSTFHG